MIWCVEVGYQLYRVVEHLLDSHKDIRSPDSTQPDDIIFTSYMWNRFQFRMLGHPTFISHLYHTLFGGMFPASFLISATLLCVPYSEDNTFVQRSVNLCQYIFEVTIERDDLEPTSSTMVIDRKLLIFLIICAHCKPKLTIVHIMYYVY